MADDAAEKEASEVLHSLLSVERIQNRDYNKDANNVILITTGDYSASPCPSSQLKSLRKKSESEEGDTFLDVEVIRLRFLHQKY